MHFPNLGGLGRADYHQVIPRPTLYVSTPL